MAQPCSICVHNKRYEIDKILVERSDTYKGLGTRFGLSTSAISRHVKEGHIARFLALARDAEQASKANDLLGQIRALQDKTLGLLLAAERAGDLRTALAAVSQARSNVETLAKLRGILAQEGTINITISAEWIELRTLIVESLKPHPEAMADVLGAIRRKELAGNGHDR